MGWEARAQRDGEDALERLLSGDEEDLFGTCDCVTCIVRTVINAAWAALTEGAGK